MTDNEAAMATFRAIVALAERLTGDKLEVMCDEGGKQFWLSSAPDRYHWIKRAAVPTERPSQQEELPSQR